MENKLLKRQIRKYLADFSATESKALKPFLDSVEAAYFSFEKDRKLMDRAVEISSEELLYKNKKLQEEADAQKAIFEKLRISIQALSLEEDYNALTETAGGFELTKYIQDLVRHRNKDREQLDFLQQAVNQGEVTAFIWEEDAKHWSVKYVSQNIEKFGYKPKEFIEKKIIYRDIIHKEDIARIHEETEAFKAAGAKKMHFEYRIIGKAGNVYWVQEQNTPHFDDDGKIIRFKGTIVDITDRVEKEALIQAQEEKLRTVLYRIGEAVFVLDEDKRIVLFNKMAEEISDFEAEEVLYARYLEKLHFVHEKKEDPIPDLVEIAMETGGIETLDQGVLLRTKTGRKVPVTITAAPMKDAQKNITGCVIVFRDVTKEHEVDRMKTEFVSIASHQLRTPVTAIRWLLELLKEDAAYENLNAQQKDYLGQIEQSAERMVNLVDDLLDVSRIETGRKFAIVKKVQNIRGCLDEAVMENQALATQKSIKIKLEPDVPQEISLPVDQAKIVQVFNNFISNSIKYSPAGSTVLANGWEKEKEWVFSITDSGIGIPASEKSHIFEKFYRATNSQKTKTQGTGLGLYIARRIVEGHGGQVWFESQKSRGATFYFSLPKT